ncbi:GNAT family N-acetyltransferase [Trichocoleus sp. FACHB-262]|uniref:GNAT family N-acetyltransferase n=1 Tax=Trichocoleus sp. FACHB-262 TaxID=2692869 RepID=UPI001F54D346|nr:GNAT family N-acetyltransferase [Trichocoleus sp. FACHB-262]
MRRSIQLLSGTGAIVTGLLCDMRERHLEDFETIWQGTLRLTDQADRDWRWNYKLQQADQAVRYEAYAIEVDSLTQGLMWLETQWHRSQLPQRDRLVYVEALAVAPWNRRLLEDPPYLRGVGRTLLLWARQRSLELGYDGRVGLHALPGSEGFYRRNQMAEYGPDSDKEGLIYFEYSLIRG